METVALTEAAGTTTSTDMVMETMETETARATEEEFKERFHWSDAEIALLKNKGE